VVARGSDNLVHVGGCNSGLSNKLHSVLAQCFVGDGDLIEGSGAVLHVGDAIRALENLLGGSNFVEKMWIADARLFEAFVFEVLGSTSLVALVASWIFGVVAVFGGWCFPSISCMG